MQKGSGELYCPGDITPLSHIHHPPHALSYTRHQIMHEVNSPELKLYSTTWAGERTRAMSHGSASCRIHHYQTTRPRDRRTRFRILMVLIMSCSIPSAVRKLLRAGSVSVLSHSCDAMQVAITKALSRHSADAIWRITAIDQCLIFDTSATLCGNWVVQERRSR